MSIFTMPCVWTLYIVCFSLIARGIDTRTTGARASLVKHIVHIGVDGLKPACIANSSTGSPNILKRLGEEGTFTLTKARTTIQTVSAPGWSATLCALDMASTGVIDNNWEPPWLGFNQSITPVTGNKEPFPCVFATIKEQNPKIKTASFYDWNWLRFLMNFGIPGSVDHDFFCDGSGKVGKGKCDNYIAGNASMYLKNLFRSQKDTKSYTFIYFGHMDDIGHAKSWCGIEYEKEVGLVDAFIGQILDVIDQSGLKDDVLVMLSADHGGERFGHGYQDDACLIIPMFIRGPSVKRNYQFQYPVRNMDMVPTGLHALGLKPNEFWKGIVMEEAFEKGF